MKQLIKIFFFSLLCISCLRAKKSPFDLRSSAGIFGTIAFSSDSNNISFSSQTVSSKDITSFSIQSPAATGVITDSNIAISVPIGTNVTNLVASFTTSGQSVKVGSITQISGVTENDFTNPVVYTVIAADNSSKNYTITVTESGQVSSPSFNIPTGTYSANLAITISTTTVGALIYFNRSTGSAPTDPDCTGVGTLYSGPITVDSTGTIIKAIACKSGLAASPIITATYTLQVAAIYPNSNNVQNRVVTPFTFTGSTAPVEVTKCLSYTVAPSCNADGTCNNGSTNLAFSAPIETVTVQAIGCRVNYLPSVIQSITFTVSARRSPDNVYLTIVDPDSNGTLLLKKIYICSEGETYNSTTGNCQGVANEYQFCATDNNNCNGGTDTGTANNSSSIFTYCENKTDGGLSNWRVPTTDELRSYFAAIARQPNGFPSTAGADIWSNQSVLSGSANTVYYTYPAQVNILQTQKTLARKLRCIHD